MTEPVEPKAVLPEPASLPRPAIVPASSHRSAICVWGMWAVANRAHIDYAETRPIPVNDPAGTLPFTTDCSGFVVLMARWAGCATDPSGQRYDGEGYTGSMVDFCNEIEASVAEPGDIIIFGPGVGYHVGLIVGKGPDGIGGLGPVGNGTPLGEFRMVSHGHPGTPEVITSGMLADAVNAAKGIVGPAEMRFYRWMDPVD
jgi:hypothetical protein